MILSNIGHFLRDESGATAIEYAFIVALVSLAILSGISVLGTKVAAMFTTVDSKFPTS